MRLLPRASLTINEQPRYELLVGSESFWRRARTDIEQAKRRVLVQALTFEGDATGLDVAEVLKRSAARDRRVLVDDFTRMVVNDSFVRSPRYLTDRAFRAEVRATGQMFRDLAECGVGVRVTNPLRGNPLRYGLIRGPWSSRAAATKMRASIRSRPAEEFGSRKVKTVTAGLWAAGSSGRSSRTSRPVSNTGIRN